MKKVVALLIATIFALSSLTISFAEEQKTTTPVSVERPKIKQITGEVTSVDTKAMTVTVVKKMRDRVREVVASITDKTKIKMGKENKTLADLKVGDEVTMKYTESEGKNIAKSIAIKPTATEKKSEK